MALNRVVPYDDRVAAPWEDALLPVRYRNDEAALYFVDLVVVHNRHRLQRHLSLVNAVSDN